MLDLADPINVWVLFKKNEIHPHSFFWKDRQIKVEKINLVHTTKVGVGICYHFSVSSSGNFYQLGFDLDNLRWFIEAVEEG